MEIGFITSFVLLTFFVLLATYDDIYLHLVKYRLYRYGECKMEHVTHTVRAVLFPLILYFLFLSTDSFSFYLGLVFVLADIITLGIDAYTEKDSRKFMGGLPRWEYIIHLFVNGFHFASISVYLVLKIKMDDSHFQLIHNFEGVASYPVFVRLITNLIPGAIIMALLHVFLNYKRPQRLWDRLLDKLTPRSKTLQTTKQ